VWRQPLSRYDQSQNQEVVWVQGVQRFLTDPLQELQEVLVLNRSVERQPNLMRVSRATSRQEPSTRR
jgi:hypothetical protein